jgi:energy-converting hydrogenase A subunit M
MYLAKADRTPVEELRKQYEALEAERDAIAKKLAEMPALQTRFRQICGYASKMGGLERLHRRLRDAAYPILKEPSPGDCKTTRIIDVYGDWITTREDGAAYNDVVQYSVADGRRKYRKSGRDNIDVDKALALWEKHQNKK